MKQKKRQTWEYVVMIAGIIGLILFLSLGAKAQDCNSSNTLIVASANIGLKNYSMVPQFKVGLWRNVNPSGWTAFVGYRDSQPITVNSNKGIDTIYSSGVFFEAGWKQRLSSEFILNVYGGINQLHSYIAADLLCQLNHEFLVALSYKEKVFGVGFYLRLNQ